jgi:acetyl-CoA C-acetyltransferase
VPPGEGFDPRAPVIVGAAQLMQRPADVRVAASALDLMVEVAAAALNDASGALGRRLELVVAIDGIWRYPDPARDVADRIGAAHAATALAKGGGHSPQRAVDTIAERIASGGLDAALVVGAEEVWSRRKLRALGARRQDGTEPSVGEPDEVFGADIVLGNAVEERHGVRYPVHVYPMFETALRHRRGESVAAHRTRLSTFWAGFSEVAAENPYAWDRRVYRPQDILEEAPDNRLVNYPYTKRCNSNIFVDQAAALVVCSAGAAAAAGVPRDRWVFLHGAGEADDTTYVSHRRELFDSPAIAAAGAGAFAAARCDADDLPIVDLYSCFPSAVQIGAAALGVDDGRPLTVTGGMPFAGGPANNYVTHSIATTVGRLRAADRGTRALVTANGGYLSKHAVAVYGNQPSGKAFEVCRSDPSPPQRTCTDDHVGPATVEAYTVMTGRDGDDVGLLAVRLDDDRRAWCRTGDPGTIGWLTADDVVGRRVHRTADGQAVRT